MTEPGPFRRVPHIENQVWPPKDAKVQRKLLALTYLLTRHSDPGHLLETSLQKRTGGLGTADNRGLFLGYDVDESGKTLTLSFEDLTPKAMPGGVLKMVLPQEAGVTLKQTKNKNGIVITSEDVELSEWWDAIVIGPADNLRKYENLTHEILPAVIRIAERSLKGRVNSERMVNWVKENPDGFMRLLMDFDRGIDELNNYLINNMEMIPERFVNMRRLKAIDMDQSSRYGYEFPGESYESETTSIYPYMSLFSQSNNVALFSMRDSEFKKKLQNKMAYKDIRDYSLAVQVVSALMEQGEIESQTGRDNDYLTFHMSHAKDEALVAAMMLHVYETYSVLTRERSGLQGSNWKLFMRAMTEVLSRRMIDNRVWDALTKPEPDGLDIIRKYGGFSEEFERSVEDK